VAHLVSLSLFGGALLLALGSGIGIAYHDGVNAEPLATVSASELGQVVTIKGTVIASDDPCQEGVGSQTVGNGSCIALRDSSNSTRFAVVTLSGTPPPLDSVAVVHGTLRLFFNSTDLHNYARSQSGAGSQCSEGGTYGTACAWMPGGYVAWNWPGVELLWVDANDVSEPWVFR
jgi:hypothetical protein